MRLDKRFVHGVEYTRASTIQPSAQRKLHFDVAPLEAALQYDIEGGSAAHAPFPRAYWLAQTR